MKGHLDRRRLWRHTLLHVVVLLSVLPLPMAGTGSAGLWTGVTGSPGATPLRGKTGWRGAMR
jgi:hypothetical protein